MKILFIGEIVGKKGLDLVSRVLPDLIKEENLDFVIANGNKINKGFSIVASEADELHAAGVDVITLGDNCFKKKATVDFLEDANAVLRPINSFYGNPGKGYIIMDSREGIPVCVVSAFGRTNFKNPVLDNPFLGMKRLLNHIAGKSKIIIMDFHCNATSEKLCMGFYMSGKITAVVGTNFSAQTSDLRLDENGTAYITDVGMVGSKYSVCGYEPQNIIDSYLSGLFPRKRVKESDYIFNSLIIEVDPSDGRATDVRTHNFEEGNGSAKK
ncbi:MAG: metallophosphoesterase [candidate division Zixibacteria bacterium]|nr:metallophosphoesterase [candidate division Zixibacteria bacterium]